MSEPVQCPEPAILDAFEGATHPPCNLREAQVVEVPQEKELARSGCQPLERIGEPDRPFVSDDALAGTARRG
jgi:hypothetical protein